MLVKTPLLVTCLADFSLIGFSAVMVFHFIYPMGTTTLLQYAPHIHAHIFTTLIFDVTCLDALVENSVYIFGDVIWFLSFLHWLE